jgi:hypothetical protein
MQRQAHSRAHFLVPRLGWLGVFIDLSQPGRAPIELILKKSTSEQTER